MRDTAVVLLRHSAMPPESLLMMRIRAFAFNLSGMYQFMISLRRADGDEKFMPRRYCFFLATPEIRHMSFKSAASPCHFRSLPPVYAAADIGQFPPERLPDGQERQEIEN